MSNPLDKASSIVDIYQKDEDMLLLGKTGSGKSTSLKELTLKLIESELKKGENVENANFPIFYHYMNGPQKRNHSKYG